MSKNPLSVKIENIVKDIKNVINTSNKDFAVAFSGGKDSTLTLLLFFEAIKSDDILKNKKYFINFSDTLMEMPIYEIYVMKTLQRLKRFIKDHNFNIVINITTPETKNKFFNLIIGNGQPMPRTDMRWCSDRLKILPQQKLQRNNVITIIGARKEESADRKKRLESNAFENNSHLKVKNNEISLYAPIENFTTKEVWEGIKILSAKQEWINYDELLKLYQIAGNTNSNAPEARFGCWVCPLLKEDKTLKNIALNHPEYKELVEFRNFFVKFQTKWAENNILYRDVYNHRNHKINYYIYENDRKGMISPGGYSLYIRKIFLSRLMDILNDAKEKDNSFPIDTYLNAEDIVYIQEKWFMEGDFNLTAFEFAKEKFNMDLKLKDEAIILIRKMMKIISVDNLVPLINVYINDESLNELRTEVQAIKRFLKQEQINSTEFKTFGDIARLTYQYIKNRSQILNKMEQDGFYFGDSSLEYLTAEVWNNDQVDFWTFMKRFENGEIQQNQISLFDEVYTDKWDRHFAIKKELENIDDVLDSKLLTIEEKIRYLEGF